MVLWYTAMSILIVANVFRSAGLDYRLVALGSLLPLALALPRMLREIEAALATAGPGETWRLRRRAELLRGLLLQRTVGPGENPFASSFPANGSGIGDRSPR